MRAWIMSTIPSSPLEYQIKLITVCFIEREHWGKLVFKMATAFSPGGQSPTSLSRTIEKVFEEAQYTGEILLSGRKLKGYPKVASKYDMVDTSSAGEFVFMLALFLSKPKCLTLSQSCQNILEIYMIERYNFSVHLPSFHLVIDVLLSVHFQLICSFWMKIRPSQVWHNFVLIDKCVFSQNQNVNVLTMHTDSVWFSLWKCQKNIGHKPIYSDPGCRNHN